ncbi:MAG: hypothetical protein ACRD2W_24750 [Acidimicrobiales bacterium]
MHADDSTNGAPREASVIADTSPHYVIRVKGHLDARWASWFDGMRLIKESNGTTTIQGAVVDQAALHGLLQKLRDAGIPLISLAPVQPDH